MYKTITVAIPNQIYLKVTNIHHRDGTIDQVGVSTVSLPMNESPSQPNLIERLVYLIRYPSSSLSYSYYTVGS